MIEIRINIKTITFIILCFVAQLAQAQDWPRTFENADGTQTVIEKPPQRILSTAVSVTGTLLAIDAPVVASATTMAGDYFAQWQSLAKQRGVEALWPAGSVDLESAYAVAPDLIVVSTSGADSALAQVEEFKMLAPTIVVDYTDVSWQKLAKQLAQATGQEQAAKDNIAQFNQLVKTTRDSIQLPEGKTNIVSFQGAGVVNAIAKPLGTHAQLLKSLGFNIEAPKPEWQSGPISHRDFMRVHYENLTELTAPTTFLLSRGRNDIQAFTKDPVLQNLPSIQAQQVYGLGENSFRIDLFSAREIVNNIAQIFSQKSD